MNGSWRVLVTKIPGSETGSLETEKRVHRIHDTLDHRIADDAPQLIGLHKGGWRIKALLFYPLAIRRRMDAKNRCSTFH